MTSNPGGYPAARKKTSARCEAAKYSKEKWAQRFKKIECSFEGSGANHVLDPQSLENCGNQPDLSNPDSGRGTIPLFGRWRLAFDLYQPTVPIAAVAGLVVAIACGAFAITNPLIGFLIGYMIMALILGLIYAVNA